LIFYALGSFRETKTLADSARWIGGCTHTPSPSFGLTKSQKTKNKNKKKERETVRKKYTTFSTERIVALQSVNNIFPESYDFASISLCVFYTLYMKEFVSFQGRTFIPPPTGGLQSSPQTSCLLMRPVQKILDQPL
jgi:hypothetical protein